MKILGRSFSLKYFALTLGVAGGLVALGSLFSLFFTVNVTDSEPMGLYAYAAGSPTIGDYIVFSSSQIPVKAPWIPPVLLKNVRALPGDHVVVDNTGVFINGVKVALRPRTPLLKPYFLDETIPEGQAFLLAPKPLSFDSRHYGPVAISSLRKVIPVCVF